MVRENEKIYFIRGVVIMTRDEFFLKLKENCNTDKEYIVELLKLRGFLFDEDSERLMLSDNGHASDYNYLQEILRKYHLGIIANGEILIDNFEYNDFIENEFKINKEISFPVCCIERDWKYFKQRIHGHKVPVAVLEPFIARYIKAISSCGVLTDMSCDGNHNNKNKMHFYPSRLGSGEWHKLICEKCLIDRFKIPWSDDYTSMLFLKGNKYDTYYEVNKAAEYLYNNRIKIREIKQSAFKDISSSYLRHHSANEIENEFIARATELFDMSGL